MKYAFIQLKNGYNTRIPCEFFSVTDDKKWLEIWGKVSRVGLFPLDEIEIACITEKNKPTVDIV